MCTPSKECLAKMLILTKRLHVSVKVSYCSVCLKHFYMNDKQAEILAQANGRAEQT